MLKIVARYAKNPLAQANSVGKDNSVVGDSEMDDSVYGEEDDAFTSHEFQTDETEQLIRAVAKITDLLRKCWGKHSFSIFTPATRTSFSNIFSFVTFASRRCWCRNYIH
jgi:hypothetical protein